MQGAGTAKSRPSPLSLTGPQRALIWSSFTNRIGSGLFNATSILYFTRIVHLPAAKVGLGLTLAGLIGLLAGVPFGHLADRCGPRLVTLVTLVIQAATMTAFVLVHTWAVLTLIVSLDLLAASANNAARGALIARVGGTNPAAFRARLRNYVNLALLLGTGGAALVIQMDYRAAYTALILVNASTYVIGALLLLRVPAYPAIPAARKNKLLSVLTDRPFVAFAVLNGAMGLEYEVIAVLLPIWISAHTHAPTWTVAAVFGCNTALGILLQVRIGSTIKTARQGGRAFRRAGMIFLISCPLMAVAANLPSWEATALILAAVCLHSVGTVLHSSAGFTLGFGLAPDHAQGQYQGMIGLGFDAGQAIAPAFLTVLCLGLGLVGWLVLAGLLAVLGLLGPPTASWAIKQAPARRSDSGEPERSGVQA
jgi:MFS family permease